MRSIRFIQIGEENNTIIHNLVDNLNSIQQHTLFAFYDDILNRIENIRIRHDEYSCRDIEIAVKDYWARRNYKEYPLAVTSWKLEDEIFYDSDKDYSIISTNDWYKYSECNISKAIEYFIAAILLDTKLETGLHEEARSCPNDLCWNNKDVNLGLSKCEYCPDCKKLIHSGLQNGKLTLHDIISIYQILDDVISRKYCFILMPFRKQFNPVYAKIKNSVEQSGYTCRRADEISQTRSIMDIITEQVGRSNILIADLTGKNPNVFYELGYSHGLGKNTILITQNKNEVPFDLRHRQYVVYGRSHLDSLGEEIKRYL